MAERAMLAWGVGRIVRNEAGGHAFLASFPARVITSRSPAGSLTNKNSSASPISADVEIPRSDASTSSWRIVASGSRIVRAGYSEVFSPLAPAGGRPRRFCAMP